jgi:hypothetical protein
MTIYAVITFHNTHFALKAKKALEKSGKTVETIPVPREFSSECGFCCKIPWDDRDTAERILREHDVQTEHIYRWERDEEREQRKKYSFV